MEDSNHSVIAWGLLCKAHASVARRLEAALSQEYGLSLATYSVLQSLADAPDHRLRLATLVESSHLSKSGVSRLIDRLEKTQYVTCEGCPSDRRGAFAVLTPAGLEVVQRASQTFCSGVREALDSSLDCDAVAQLGGLLQRIS